MLSGFMPTPFNILCYDIEQYLAFPYPHLMEPLIKKIMCAPRFFFEVQENQRISLFERILFLPEKPTLFAIRGCIGFFLSFYSFQINLFEIAWQSKNANIREKSLGVLNEALRLQYLSAEAYLYFLISTSLDYDDQAINYDDAKFAVALLEKIAKVSPQPLLQLLQHQSLQAAQKFLETLALAEKFMLLPRDLHLQVLSQALETNHDETHAHVRQIKRAYTKARYNHFSIWFHPFDNTIQHDNRGQDHKMYEHWVPSFLH
jgi:hypothetical protein